MGINHYGPALPVNIYIVVIAIAIFGNQPYLALGIHLALAFTYIRKVNRWQWVTTPDNESCD